MHTRLVVIILLHCSIVWLSNITPCIGQGSGQGSGQGFIDISCEDPGSPANGSSKIVIGKDGTDGTQPIGTIIKYTCSLGFRLVGSTVRLCQLNGEWSGTVPVCQLICQDINKCGPPAVPDGGSVSFTNSSAGCEAVYRCNNRGKKLVGNARRVCQPNGTWSGTTPTCESVDCGKPNEIDNGRIFYISTTFRSLVMYQCNYGFRRVGILIRMCTLSGLWFGGVPSCRPIECGPPAVPANAFLNNENTTLNATVTYSCKSSYALCGVRTRTCLPDGTWTGPVPRCVKPVAIMASTSYEVNEADSFANITVMLDQPSCDNVTITAVPISVNASKSDFENSSITINISPGDTSAIIPFPILDNIRVERVESFDVVLTSSDGTVAIGSPSQANVAIFDDDDISVSFEQSVYLVTQKRIEVCVNKVGKHDFPITVQIQQQDAEGAVISNFSLRFKIKQTELCFRQRVIADDGSISSFNLTLVPDRLVRIGTNGTAHMFMRCGDPGRFVNGSANYRGTAFGMVVSYSCDDGFELIGSTSRRCLDTGLWSGSLPVCNLVDCSVEGQQYLPCNGRCDPTCANDPPVVEFCPLCIPECRCPSGTVLDEIVNRCVKSDECSEEI